jgi:hypothetical protein
MMQKFALVFQSFTDGDPVQLHSNGVSEIPQFDSLIFTLFPHILLPGSVHLADISLLLVHASLSR